MPELSTQSAETKTCPKCGGSMEKGRLSAQTYGIFPRATAQFITWSTEERRKDWKFIRVFACTQCGYLESYLGQK